MSKLLPDPCDPLQTRLRMMEEEDPSPTLEDAEPTLDERSELLFRYWGNKVQAISGMSSLPGEPVDHSYCCREATTLFVAYGNPDYTFEELLEKQRKRKQ
jgi:hypothetical protein